MSDQLPSYGKPPVVETALSVQFAPNPKFMNAHLGIFWQRIKARFPLLSEANPLEPQFERFGEDVLQRRVPEFRIARLQPATRLQAASTDQHALVQVQNGRFVFNWRRLETNADYPRWNAILPRFKSEYAEFVAYLDDEGFGVPTQNQWEVTYVNYLEKDREWRAVADWANVIPGMVGSATRKPTPDLEDLEMARADWHYPLAGQAGRLHVDLRHAFTGSDESVRELLVFQLTARGEINERRDLDAGLNIGHEAIVNAFTALTSERVHDLWKRQR